MAIQATFKITSELLREEACRTVARYRESCWIRESMYFKHYKKTAEISSPLFNEPVKVFYYQYQTFTDSISRDAVSITVIKPIDFTVVRRGLNAEELCQKALCFEIERYMFQKKHLKVVNPLEFAGFP